MKHRTQPFVLLLTLCASCSAPGFSVEATWNELDLEGDIALATSGNPLAQNSLDGLGVGGDESSLAVRADAQWGVPHITLGTQSGEWSGSGQVNGSFGGIAGSVDVDSNLDFALHRGLITFDLVPVPVVEFGIGLGVSVLDIDADVSEQANPSNTENVDEVLPVPVIAVRGAVQVWRFELEALVSGMSADVGGDHAEYFDYDVSGRFRLGGLGPVDAHLTAGYRRIDLEADYEDSDDEIETDFTLDGVYFGFRLSV